MNDAKSCILHYSTIEQESSFVDLVGIAIVFKNYKEGDLMELMDRHDKKLSNRSAQSLL